MTALRSPFPSLSPIAEDVLKGLSLRPRKLPPKLFYDAEGSRLFDEITKTPEYYPTRTEREILRRHSPEILRLAGNDLALVELGAGSADKTTLLIRALSRRQDRLEFYPIDVSSAALQQAQARLRRHFPQLQVKPIVADYSTALPRLHSIRSPKLVMFIGSTIGNFEPDEAVLFLRGIARSLRSQDALLLGADLRKSAAVLHAAYNDAQGITAAFNKNMLARINRELGGTFRLDQFKHVAFWNPRQSRIEMHLESLCEQDVWIADLSYRLHFCAGERLHTENSYKFSISSISDLLTESGFRLEKYWTDPNRAFCVLLARV